jgi:coiled-coil domain-containing protein 12
MSSHEALSAAANDRKSRLAQLKSLKRKQAPSSDESPDTSTTADTSSALTLTSDTTLDNSVTSTYLSGRNFDPATRNVKLGFDSQPISDPTSTLEYKAQQLALESKVAQDAEKSNDNAGLDLFKLQPKKPNWDLKRDLAAKIKPLDVQTENAIARMVKERIEGQKAIKEKEVGGKSGAGGNEGDGEEVGMEGTELVEAMHLKEQEDERERRRDEEDEDVS